MKVSKAGKIRLDYHRIHSKNNLDPDFANPCDSPMLRKLLRPKIKAQLDILEKEREKGWIPLPGTTLQAVIIFAHR